MVEAGAAEARLQPVAETGVVAEHHSFQDRAPLSREAGCGTAPEPRAQAVAHRAEAAAPADDMPFVDAQHDVDSLTPQPTALVEAVLRGTRQSYDAEQAHDGALGRRSSQRQLELHPFVDATSLEAPGAGEESLREHAAARLAGDDDEEPPGAADIGAQHASVECVEPRAPPAPAGQECESGKWRASPGRRTNRREGGDRDGEQRSRKPEPEGVGQGKPRHRGAHEQVCGQQPAHGTTSPCRSAIRAGPMPGIASSPSTDVNGPCCCR